MKQCEGIQKAVTEGRLRREMIWNKIKRCKRMCLWSLLHAPCTPSPGGSQLPASGCQFSQACRKWIDTRLLDIRNLGSKPLRDLWNDFLDQRLVLHLFPGFHDSGCNDHWVQSLLIEIQTNYSPNNSCLDDIFTVFVYRLENIGGLSLDLSLDRLVEVDTNLLRSEAYNKI